MPPTDPQPALAARAPVGALRGSDLLAFNQHLAALATAGLPLERGIRLAAQEARAPSVARAINALADDLDAGTPLPAAFDRHRANFPPVYARLMEAAMATNNLPALLLSLSKHQESVDRLRSVLVRAVSYPLTILIGVLVVMTMVSIFVLPPLRQTHGEMIALTQKQSQRYDWRTGRTVEAPRFPLSATIVLAAGPYLPYAGGGLLLLLAALPAAVVAARVTRRDGALADGVLARLPLVGPPVRHAALARFHDALAIGVGAGMDLPRALRTAGDLVGYPRLRADAERLAAALESGRPASAVAASPQKLRLLPATLPDTLDAASLQTSLPETLESLALLHRQQAELRAQRVPLILLPFALTCVGALVALLLAGIISPLTSAFRMLGI